MRFICNILIGATNLGRVSVTKLDFENIFETAMRGYNSILRDKVFAKDSGNLHAIIKIASEFGTKIANSPYDLKNEQWTVDIIPDHPMPIVVPSHYARTTPKGTVTGLISIIED